MSKRDPNTDQPRRIYRSTLERIDRHLSVKAKPSLSGRTQIKSDFNKFLVTLLNVYEELQKEPIVYVNSHHIYTDPGEARGEALMLAHKTKQPVKSPLMMIQVGEDDEL